MIDINDKIIAVFIDFDNFNNEADLKILFDELEQYGSVIYKGAFYTNTKDKNVSEKSKEYGINDFIVEPSYSNGKNAVDIRIALDVMEWLEKEYVDCFVLATNDLDFAPIAKRLRQKNKIVIGAGTASKSEDYKKLFSRYISIDIIKNATHSKPIDDVKDKNVTTIKDKKIPITNSLIELIKITTLILNNNEKDEEGYIQFSFVIEELYKKIPDFNPKNYGSQNNKPSLFFKEKLKDNFDIKQVGKIHYIRIK
ncbi:NYN domain-containing protein [Spiroplasma endosymbiont of Aspidapion aeneum]|uniref:NYN domain-containing protein n=1 Tax=Spiroplasma endosymbiont of Aspidapion aeneum TaxID=3066276 RepID=UPI00313CB64F